MSLQASSAPHRAVTAVTPPPAQQQKQHVGSWHQLISPDSEAPRPKLAQTWESDDDEDLQPAAKRPKVSPRTLGPRLKSRNGGSSRPTLATSSACSIAFAGISEGRVRTSLAQMCIIRA